MSKFLAKLFSQVDHFTTMIKSLFPKVCEYIYEV